MFKLNICCISALILWLKPPTRRKNIVLTLDSWQLIIWTRYHVGGLGTLHCVHQAMVHPAHLFAPRHVPVHGLEHMGARGDCGNHRVQYLVHWGHLKLRELGWVSVSLVIASTVLVAYLTLVFFLHLIWPGLDLDIVKLLTTQLLILLKILK